MCCIAPSLLIISPAASADIKSPEHVIKTAPKTAGLRTSECLLNSPPPLKDSQVFLSIPSRSSERTHVCVFCCIMHRRTESYMATESHFPELSPSSTALQCHQSRPPHPPLLLTLHPCRPAASLQIYMFPETLSNCAQVSFGCLWCCGVKRSSNKSSNNQGKVKKNKTNAVVLQRFKEK